MPGKFFQKPGKELAERVPPGQHLAKGFPVLTYGDTPQVSRDIWQFRVWGLVKEDKTFTWDDFMAMPQTDFTADFHCVTTWSKLDVQWTGVRVVDFIRHLDLDPRAMHVMEHCYGGYTTNLSMDDFLREENFLLTLYLVNHYHPITEGRCGWWYPICMPGKVPSGLTAWNFWITWSLVFGNGMGIIIGVNPGQKSATAFCRR